jgi:hypothetical protein
VPNYIPDGYTQHGHIKPAQGLHDGCSWTYRPILTADRAEITRQMELEKDARRGEAVSAVAMAQRIIAWDIVDDKQKEVPITGNNILHLQPMLYLRMWKVMIGLEAGDVREDNHLSPEQEDQVALALAGQTPLGN